MSYCCKCKAGICIQKECDSICDCHLPEYPNDKETQEWMNAPLGKSISTPEQQVKFWSDKYDAKVDELHEMWKEARSFEGSFNAAIKTISEAKNLLNWIVDNVPSAFWRENKYRGEVLSKIGEIIHGDKVR